MSFILQTAAKFGCPLTERSVELSVRSVNKTALKSPHIVARSPKAVGALSEGALFGSGVRPAPLTEASFKAAVDSVRSAGQSSISVGHAEQRIAFLKPDGSLESKPISELSPKDYIWMGLYEIKTWRRLLAREVAIVKTPAGDYYASRELLEKAPKPR